MRKEKKLLLTLLLTLIMSMSISIITCAASPKLNKTSITLNVGKSTTLKLLNNSKTVQWSSSNKAVAIVSSKGKVTAKKSGTAKITAKVGSKKYTCNVTIKENSSEFDKIKNYIIKYNGYNTNDDLHIMDTYYSYDSDMRAQYALIYDKKTNKINMDLAMDYNTSGLNIFCNLSIVPSMENLKCEFLAVKDDFWEYADAYATINPKTMKNYNIKFKVNENDLYDYSSSKVKEKANLAFSVGFTLWDVLLKRCGSSLKMLGFKNL